MGKLPTSLEVVCRLMVMLGNPTQENDHVVVALFSDRLLAGQLVRKLDTDDDPQVDEKGNPIERKFTDDEVLDMLHMAVLKLGYTAILRLVSALSVGKILANEHKGYGMQRRELWVHSVVVALIAMRLCQILEETGRDSINPTLAFIGGLMHDTGKAALSADLMQRLPEVKKAAFDKDFNWVNIETEYCKIDHAQIGARLLKKWKIPQEVTDAVAFHHQPQKDQKLAALIHLADYASRFVTNPGGWSGYATKVDPAAFEICHLRPDDIQLVVLHVIQDRASIEKYSNI